MGLGIDDMSLVGPIGAHLLVFFASEFNGWFSVVYLPFSL